MAKDVDYIAGLEDGASMIKSIFAMTPEEREEKFGYTLVANILDVYDVIEIRERLETLNKYYIIRGIKVSDTGFKRVVVESDRLSFKPDEVLITAFLNCHKDKHITFATVEEIYVREQR